MDQPSIDGMNTFAVSTFAREHGMKVMLSGLGADELFGGYPSFDQVPRFARVEPPSCRRSDALRPALGQRIERARERSALAPARRPA